MGYQVVWSYKAIDDVDAIASYIARDSVPYAAAVVQKIINLTRSLAKDPLAREVVEEFGEENLRQEFAYSYRVIYVVKDDVVTIAAVVHGKKLLEL
ncbi:MAG: type II toxin-antitoxin system RelE/ParE family toxin [Okeania sp. SIO2H7]|nr:type II toxin-antitoxin system RelE/ParE family toxin [Okeania sp. SIO2H7]